MELYGLYGSEEDILRLLPIFVESTDKNITYIFSDAERRGNGKRLAKVIKKYKLGQLVSTRVVVNPGSGNKIRTWLWVYNGKKIPKVK